MEIFRKFQFEAAHRLPNLPPEHKCARLHGHSYHVEVYVHGQVDEQTGWVIDFYDIKAQFATIMELLDHRYLNELPGLENPTCEVLAAWIWEHMRPLQLSKVVVMETCTSGAVYTGET